MPKKAAVYGDVVTSYALALLLVGVTACGGGGAADATRPSNLDDQGFAALELTAPTGVLTIGETFQLVATPQDESGSAITGLQTPAFETDDPTVATLDASGMLTAVEAGTTVVTATLTVGGTTKTATAPITVAELPTGNVVTTPGTNFLPDTLAIAVGDTVTWEFSGAVHNVTFGADAPEGGDIPDQQLGSGVTRVFTAPGTYDYECTNHVGMVGTVIARSDEPSVFSSLDIAPSTPAIDVGGTVQLIATPLDQHGTAISGLPAATFTSDDLARATVDATGLVEGLAGGTVTVAASVTTEGVTHTADAVVTVTAPQPGSVTVNTPNRTFSPNSVTIAAGGAVTWRFSEAVHNVTFQSGSGVSNIGDQDAGNAVSRTFSAPGVFAYECTRHDGMTGEVIVQDVGDQVYSGLSVTPASSVIGVGGTVQIVATPLDQNGLPMTGTPDPVFTTNDANIADVDGSGLVSGVAEGTTTVDAAVTYEGDTHTASASATVVAGQVFTVSATDDGFTSDDVEMSPGGTVVWVFSGSTHNVTFDDDIPPGGDILNTPAGESVARTFPTEGDYDYECTIHGDKGRVRVR